MKLPEAFITNMQQMLGCEYERFEASLIDVSPVSVRINKEKADVDGLHHLGIEQNVGWCDCGYYLKERPSFTFDPLFHAGCYYVQEASSMFICSIARQLFDDKPLKILDLCAAPGGKSTLLLSIMPDSSLLYANEISRSRCQILRENIIKWGNPNVVVTNNSSEEYSNSGLGFDIILCDAPCSGEGMFRKDPDSINEWSLDNVKMCSERQREILDNAWNCLNPGGMLIYSTCTYNIYEDETNARYIRDHLGGIPIRCETESLWGIDTTNYLGDDIPVYHFFPHKTRGEGFFVCVFRKPDDDQSMTKSKKKEKRLKNRNTSLKYPKEVEGWLKDKDYFHICPDEKDRIWCVPREYEEMISHSEHRLRIVHKGIMLASMKGKKYRPEHSLAMSNHIRCGVFPEYELDIDSSLSYLRCESLQLPQCDKGHILVGYKGIPLGFVNNIGTRANNLYPQEWRIRQLRGR